MGIPNISQLYDTYIYIYIWLMVITKSKIGLSD